MRKPILLFAMLPALAWPQSGGVAGPVSGYLLDAARHELRPILGIPGGARIGARLDLGQDASVLAVGPAQDYFLALRNSDSRLMLLRTGDLSPTALDGIAAAPERAIPSPNGSAALLTGAPGWQVLTGLPGTPRAAWSTDGFRIPDGAGALAVSDDGERLAAAVGSGDAGGAYLISRTGEVRLLASGEDMLAAFAPGSHDLLLASRRANRVWLAADGEAIRELAGPADGVNGVAGVAFSRGGTRALVANDASGEVLALGLDGSAPQRAKCDCGITTLERMGAWFRLNELTAGPLWLMESGAEPPRFWFVPAPSGGGN